MKLRTLTGTRFPATCACGCKTPIPANPEVKVTVDFDTSRPRLTYLPSHAPDAGRWRENGGIAHAEPTPSPPNGGNGHATGLPDASLRGEGPRDASSLGRHGCPPSSFTPASALPATTAAPPRAPDPPRPPKAPTPPIPLALLASEAAHTEEEASLRTHPTSRATPSGKSSLGIPSLLVVGGEEADSSPSPQAGRAWSSGGLTVNAGKFESVRAGYADYALPGETAEQLGVRVNAVIEADLRAKIALLVRLHRELGIPGPEYLRPTSSPATSAGAPQGASAASSGLTLRASPPSEPSVPRSSPPSVATSRASHAKGETPACPRAQEAGVGGADGTTVPSRTDSPVNDLVRRALAELVTDISVKRRQAKDKAAKRFCELRGLQSLRQCGSADIDALEALLNTFERIDDWSIHAGYGVPAPQLEDRVVIHA
ncbi:MAG: hypothetical protein KGJ23_13870 [Euryarchaeota archaeon]|nr:hypothetical protein [Euryarchaeota archaeon]MDE1837685.1 hypothetical protein [Euryarchaeota archaeon]MDE1881797.1 hypothetical protein [Euryarchaeota archaeon]MDE2045985.1 hypothetical protein [Thermoplasmata archaeon]